MQKILQVPPQTMNLCGLSQVILNWNKKLDADKFKFSYLCFIPPENKVKSIIESINGEIIMLPDNMSISAARNYFNTLLQKENFSAIHIHTDPQVLDIFQRILINQAYKCHIPKRILHSHNVKAKNLSWKGKIKFSLQRTLLNTFFPYKHVTHRFACSEKAGEALFGPKNFEIIENTIDTNRFKFNIDSRNELRQKYQILPSDILIGHVGYLCDTKNQIYSLKVLIELLKTNSNYKLCFVGAGNQDFLKKIVATHHIENHVIFTGEQKNVAPFYSMFDIFVLPSHYEGFPLVGIEAQTSGLPCIFSNKITPQICITDQSNQLSIQESEQNWSNYIMKLSPLSASTRMQYADFLRNKGFDIDAIIKNLENLYSINKNS